MACFRQGFYWFDDYQGPLPQEVTSVAKKTKKTKKNPFADMMKKKGAKRC